MVPGETRALTIGPRPGEELIRYPMPDPGHRIKQQSVVYGRNVDDNNIPHLPPPEVIAWLRSQGITRLVIGHTPTGDTPVVLHTLDDGFEVLSADNSYGKDPAGATSLWLRGAALEHADIRSRALVEGRWIDLDFRLTLGNRTPIGKRLPDGSVVVAPFGDRLLSYRMDRGRNFAVTYRLTDAREPLVEPSVLCPSAVAAN